MHTANPSEVRKCNKLFQRELGSNRFGEPLYKWLWSRDFQHDRLTGYELKFPPGSNVLMPEPKYERVLSYPWLKECWMFVSWQYTSYPEWRLQFGSRLRWKQQGDYYPTDLWMKEGKSPTLDATEELIRRVKHNRTVSIATLEADLESRMAAQDEAIFSTIHDIISDETTAFGNDPGKRSGGVSFPSVNSPDPSANP